MLIRRAKTIEMMELNVRIWPAIATVTLNVSPMSINSSPEIREDIIEVSADITSVIKIRFLEIVLGSFSEILVNLRRPQCNGRMFH